MYYIYKWYKPHNTVLLLSLYTILYVLKRWRNEENIFTESFILAHIFATPSTFHFFLCIQIAIWCHFLSVLRNFCITSWKAGLSSLPLSVPRGVAFPTVAIRWVPLGLSSTAASLHGLSHPGRMPTATGPKEMEAVLEENASDSHCPCSEFSSFSSMNTSQIVICLWSISWAEIVVFFIVV